MKQILTFVAFIAFSFATMSTATAQSSKEAKSSDLVMMKGGKVFLSNSGKMSELKSDFTSANGTIFKPNGTVVMNTGVSTTLKDGQSMGLDGKMIENTPASQSSKPTNLKK